MRNKIILAMAAAGMMCASSAFADVIPPPSDSGNGTITFSGSVIEAPCTISPVSQNILVDLGQVSTKSLTADGETSPDPAKIEISLRGCAFEESNPAPSSGTDLGQKSKVDVEFSNLIAVTENKGIIKNTAASNPATNVNIQLLRSDKTTPFDLTAGADDKDAATQLTPGNNTVTLWARMIASGKATQGNVGATITYKLKYF
ncbi:long polar fimbrial protein LpfA [Salmonella enterica subsp. enterica serovar Poona]|nr:long polar fimbrial protein LpfA [Salmonella enterica subsp. enterica serovar Poona]